MKSADFSKQKLAEYRQHLEEWPAARYAYVPETTGVLDNPRMFSGYPELAVGVARDRYVHH